MSSQSEIEFSSKHCKFNSHKSCIGRWTGLGFNIKCICYCHLENRAGEIIKSYDINVLQNDIPYFNQDNKPRQDNLEHLKSNEGNTSGKESGKLYFPPALLEKSHTYINSAGDLT